jgi:hypothetical protein
MVESSGRADSMRAWRTQWQITPVLSTPDSVLRPGLIQFYNDGYRQGLGPDRHPSALEQRGRECWAEIWSIIGGEVDSIMAGGDATWHEDHLVVSEFAIDGARMETDGRGESQSAESNDTPAGKVNNRRVEFLRL